MATTRLFRSALSTAAALTAILLGAAHPLVAATQGTTLDPDWVAESMQVERLVAKGSKAEALAAGNAFYEKTAAKLHAARVRAGDLSLRRLIPFLSDEERAAADNALEATRREVLALTQNYAALVQTRPAFLKKLGAEVPDQTAFEARAYEGLLTLRTGLTMAAVADLATDGKKTDAKLTHAAFIKLLEAELYGANEEAAARLNTVIAKSRPQLAPVSATTKKIVGNALDIIPGFLAATRDHDSAEDVLGSVLLLDATDARVWAARATARIDAGDAAGTARDLLVARALDPKSPAVAAAFAAFNAVPRFADRIYLEPYSELAAANAELAVMLGGKPAGDTERSANAARRNAARRLYACSFNTDTASAAAAMRWVWAGHKEHADISTPSFIADVKAYDRQFNDAPGNNVRAILQCFDDHAAFLAVVPGFWRVRAGIFVQLGQIELATACAEAAAAIDPEADFLETLRTDIAAATAARAAKK